MSQSQPPGGTRPRRRKRSLAWLYYLVIAGAGIAVAPSSHGQTLWVTAVAGLYSLYLFRGGRFVIWFW